MEVQNDSKRYPVTSSGYELLEEIGQGVSATVYRARCLAFNEIVAVKCLDLEKCVSNLDGIRREAQMMSLISHPNVVKAYCSFVVEQTLWVVMPYMAGGSCLHIMKSAYPDGFDEPIIATVLKASLKALEYLHRHGHIHRDVKAGNILVDANGAVKLGDFGVSACMFDTGDRQRSRNTFVGTPCWMAPEVMEQIHGYDFKADIWSFGITGLELAHGHAPFSKYPPIKVLLMTLQNAPPGLDYERDKRFSKMFKEMIAMCLVKDPAKRPSAEKLLKHAFFKNARNSEYLMHHVLDGLPSLGDRVKTLKMKDAVKLAQKKMPSGEWEELSQNEYKRGVSSWNFNVEDLKAQAATIQDDYSNKEVAIQEEQTAPKVHDATDGNGAPSKSRERTEGRDDLKAVDLKEDKSEAFKNRDRKDDKDGAAPVPTKYAFPTLLEDRPVIENIVVPAVSTTSKGGDAVADGGGETRPYVLTRSESMLSPHSKRPEGILRSASSGRWDQKHIGRFNVFGTAGDLGSASSHDHDEGKVGRREDGAAAGRHVTSAADRDSADDKVHSSVSGSDERDARHVPVRPKEDLPWTKPQFWERGAASARCSSSGSKEGLGIVQKKGRFSITSEDVETPSGKEREHQLQINELQSKISTLLEELQTVKSRNVELERQLFLNGGSAAKNLTAPNK